MKKHLIQIILAAIILLTGCQTVEETRQSSIWERKQADFLRISNNHTPVRRGIGDEYEIIKEMEKGQEIDVLAETNNYYIVHLEDNSLGSIQKENAEPIVKPEEEVEEEQEKEDSPEGTMEQTEEEIEPVNNSEQEQQMVDMVNNVRSENNLPSLEVDSELTQVARLKSEDMLENEYFSHYSPTYGSPFDMLDHFDVEYLHAGENIASNPSVENAHDSLMNSPGHRRNILNENYTHIGIGIVSNRRQGFIITQLFISQPR